MPPLRLKTTGAIEDVPASAVPDALATGLYEPPGDDVVVPVNVGGHLGQVAGPDLAAALDIQRATPETAAQFRARETAARIEREHGGILGGAGAFIEGAVDAATFGGYGAATDAIYGDEYTTERRERAEANPFTSGAGTLAGVLGPALLSGGMGALGAAARATPAGAASALGARIAAKGGALAHAAGFATEGALYEAGHVLSETILKDKELSAEAFLAGAAQGAALGGVGGLGVSLFSRGAQAAKRSVERMAANKTIQSLEAEERVAVREAEKASRAAEKARFAAARAVASLEREEAQGLRAVARASDKERKAAERAAAKTEAAAASAKARAEKASEALEVERQKYETAKMVMDGRLKLSETYTAGWRRAAESREAAVAGNIEATGIGADAKIRTGMASALAQSGREDAGFLIEELIPAKMRTKAAMESAKGEADNAAAMLAAQTDDLVRKADEIMAMDPAAEAGLRAARDKAAEAAPAVRDWASMAPEEARTLIQYQMSDGAGAWETTASSLNPILRRGEELSPKAAEAVSKLDAIIAKPENAIPQDAVLYRGVSRSPMPNVGDILADKAYVSTTRDPLMADAFAGRRPIGDDGEFFAPAQAGQVDLITGYQRRALEEVELFDNLYGGPSRDLTPAQVARLDEVGLPAPDKPEAPWSMEIAVPRGTPSVSIPGKQAEVLLPRDLPMEVVAVDPATRTVSVRVVAGPASSPSDSARRTVQALDSEATIEMAGEVGQGRRIAPSRDQTESGAMRRETRAAAPSAEPALAEVPRGFRVDRGSELVSGIPNYESVKTQPWNRVYVVRPSELATREIRGFELNQESTERVRKLFDTGETVQPINIGMSPEGHLHVDDGNHRLMAAASGDRPVAVKFTLRYPSDTRASSIREQLSSAVGARTAALDAEAAAAAMPTDPGLPTKAIPQSDFHRDMEVLSRAEEAHHELAQAIRPYLDDVSGAPLDEAVRPMDDALAMQDEIVEDAITRQAEARAGEAAPISERTLPQMPPMPPGLAGPPSPSPLATMPPMPGGGGAAAGGRGAGTTAVGLFDLAAAAGGLPNANDIPVIGPIVGTYLKYRAIRGALGRLGFRVGGPVARVARGAAQTQDRIQDAVGALVRGADKAAPAFARATTPTLTSLSRPLWELDPQERTAAAPKKQDRRDIKDLKNFNKRAEELRLVADDPAAAEAELAETIPAPPALAAAIARAVVARLSYLAGLLPDDPVPTVMQARQPKPVSAADMDRLATGIAATSDPVGMVLGGVARGLVSPTVVEAVKTVYPRLYQAMLAEVVEQVSQAEKPIPYDRLNALATVFDIPLDRTTSPEYAAARQAEWAAANQAQQPPMGGPQLSLSKQNQIGAVGRAMR